MTAYILLILFIIFIGFIFYIFGNRDKSIWVIMIVLILFAGLRGDFTSDYNQYVNLFLYMVEYYDLSDIFSRGLFSTSGSTETGFLLLIRFIGIFTKSEIVYMTVLSAITLLFYFSAFKRFSINPWLSVLLFVGVGDYFASFNLTRQILAAGICFWAVKYIEENKFFKYLFWILLASTIHTTALIMIPMYFILKMQITRKNILLSLGSAALIWVALPSIISIFQSHLSKYDNYSFGMNQGTFNAVIPSLGMLIFAIFSITVINRSWDSNALRNRISFNASLWAVIILSLCVQVYIVFRMSFYLKPFLCVLIPNVLQGYRSKREQMVITIIICILTLLYTYITLSGTGYEPYYFAWQSQLFL